MKMFIIIISINLKQEVLKEKPFWFIINLMITNGFVCWNAKCMCQLDNSVETCGNKQQKPHAFKPSMEKVMLKQHQYQSLVNSIR